MCIRTRRVEHKGIIPKDFFLWDTEPRLPPDTTTLLGAPSTYTPSPFRIHVILQQRELLEDNLCGFSFPLCSFKELENTGSKLFHLIGNQMRFFSEYTGFFIINVVKSWATAKGFFIDEPDSNGIMHLVLIIPNSNISKGGYLYIHNERLPEGLATATCHYHWRYVWSRLDLSTLVILEQTESPKGDSSPHSEPNLKLRRMSKDR